MRSSRHTNHPTQDFSLSGLDMLPRIYDERRKKTPHYSCDIDVSEEGGAASQRSVADCDNCNDYK